MLEPAQEQVEARLEDLLPLQRGRVRRDLAEPRGGFGIERLRGVSPRRVEIGVRRGGQPRDSPVMGSTLCVLDQLGGALVPVTP